MNILITGAGGQLGTELIRCLETGRTALGTVPERLRGAAVRAADLAAGTGEALDVTDRAAVLRAVGADADLVLNCAAMTNVDGCEGDPEAAMRVNALGARNLADAAERAGAKLVQVSTDYVFAGEGDVSYREWDACRPNTVYGKSKLLGEQYARERCSRAFIVRTAWLYGLEGRNFVKTILGAAREKGRLTVVDDQRGCPTNAADLAHHILKLADSEEYGVYHCVGRGVCSWYEFACKIVEYAGIPCETAACTTAEFPRPAPRPAFSALDNLMLRCTVGDEMRPWEEALRAFMEELLEKGGQS